MLTSEEIKAEYLRVTGYSSLRESQQIAFDQGYLENDSNFVVIAPTDAGKTGIAEMLMLKKLIEGLRIAYLVPIDALVNEKRDAFQNYWGDEYKIYPNEDDRSITFSNADIVVTTFESFYRNDLRRPSITPSFSLVVVDEFHILYDKLRGYNLEKVLTVIKSHDIQIICLSATFKDKEDVAEWLNAEIIFISDSARGVELKHNIIDLKEIPSSRQINTLFRILDERDLAPAIIFCTTRAYTKLRSEKFRDEITDEINPRSEISEKISEIRAGGTLTETQNSLISCMVKGVAFHHSGLREEIKKYIETSFRERRLNYLFSTTTLAYGVNFPAKTVILYDLTFWSQDATIDVPIHTYLQMAGRAGRASFGNEGYAYVVTKDATQLNTKAQNYIKAEIETAGSNIDEDDYFQKTILELIYANKNKQEDIISFFKETFYNFLSEKEVQLLVPFNLLDIIQQHVRKLIEGGFIVYQGAAGFRLTDLGIVTIEFLLKSFQQHELLSFVFLNRYLDEKGHVEYDFNFLYEMYKMFPKSYTRRLHRRRSEIVDRFFTREYRIRNRRGINGAEYSTYATYYGWMENFVDTQIEGQFSVPAYPLFRSAREIRNLLTVYKELAEKKHFDIPDEFNVFCDRLYFGVTQEELPFVKIRGLGRESVGNVRRFCRTSPIFIQEYSGSLLEILCQFYRDNGENEFVETLTREISGIGERRIGLFMIPVKEELGLLDD